MEFIERINLREAHFLANMTFKEYKPYDKSSTKNEEERKKNYEKMVNTCNAFIKANGEIKRLYKFTGSNNWGTDGTGSGRLFAGGNGVQGLPKKIRGFLLKHLTTDIDMVNCHPVILRYLCVKHNVKHDELDLYINERDSILARFPDRDTAKTMYLKAVNDDKLNRKEKDEGFKMFDKECKEIQKVITKLTCYSNIVADVPANRLYNWYGSAINRILCYYENRVLQIVINTLNKKNIEICAPMFDGGMIYGNYYKDTELLEDIETAVQEVFPEMDMKFSYKSHNNEIVMPDDYEIPEAIDYDALNTFEKVSAEFEKNHCKITNKAIFVKECEDKIIPLSKTMLITAYEHMSYQVVKDQKIIECNFINDWIKSNPKQRSFEDIGCFPVGTTCPPNMYNSWIPFAMERVTAYEEKPLPLQMILNHIRILCGNDENAYDYFIKWIAQMIQYPAVKSICPILISKEGAGKGTLLKLLCRMLGEEKVFETATPSRDIWGDFNGRMANTFLVNLNELSKKETIESEGRIKALITDPKLTINNKGVSQYDIDSHHRFIITTNNEEPINTAKDDRRKFIVRCSDELIGNTEYFNILNQLISDVNVVKTCYEYFKNIPDMDKFNKIPMPATEFHNNLKELSKSPIELWLEDMCYKHATEYAVTLTGEEAFKRFKSFCESQGFQYDINAQKLGIRLSNMKIKGIEKGNSTAFGKTKVFYIQALQEHFGLSCQIKM
jgi:hypothetical protein